MMKKTVVFILIIILTLMTVVALSITSVASASIVMVIEDFESGMGDWSANPVFKEVNPQTITAAQNTINPLVGSGSMTVTLSGIDPMKQAIGAAWNGTEASNWDGVCFRMDARNISDQDPSEASLMQVQLAKSSSEMEIIPNVIFIDITNGISNVSYGTFFESIMIPRNFNGFVFCEFEGITSLNSAIGLQVAFSDSTFSYLSGRSFTIDQYAYYLGTDYTAVINDLDPSTIISTPTNSPTNTPTAISSSTYSPTTDPTDELTEEPDNTADVSILGYAVAAVVAGAAGLLVFKKK